MSDLPRVTHYGTIHIGDINLDAVVLADETRAYIQNQLMKAVGFIKENRGTQERRFLADFAPKSLLEIQKTGLPKIVKMPHGGNANIYPSGILTEIVSNVIDAALDGRLHHKQQHIIKPCQAIYRALAETGEVALIDEATGYQYHRAPDALQDLFGMLIRQTCADWERRFHPDYYGAIFKLFGWTYTGQRLKPSVVGQITEQLVYGAVFPADVMVEVKERRGRSAEKLHQWLKDGGLSLLEKQIAAVTMIARSSTDYQDFKNRCLTAFHSLGQMGFIFPTHGGAA